MLTNIVFVHASRVHRKDAVVETCELALVFPDQRRAKRPVAISLHLNGDHSVGRA